VNQLKSQPGSTIQNAGVVRFESKPIGQHYRPFLGKPADVGKVVLLALGAYQTRVGNDSAGSGPNSASSSTIEQLSKEFVFRLAVGLLDSTAGAIRGPYKCEPVKNGTAGSE
jgi:hypothetical protein